MNTVKFKLKSDRYSRSRGGNSKFFNIHCSQCNSFILLYQKDGKGNLLRLYLDRIFAPNDKVHIGNNVLKCPHCESIIGHPMIYEPESRPAIRLVYGAFTKEKSDGTYEKPIDLALEGVENDEV